MARQVLPVVGAAVGYFYGGPQGAQLGWAIGTAIGGAVDPLIIPGPRIGEVAQQTSQEGVPRPIVFAMSPPIPGNIIVTSEPNIVRSTESQGKGGPKVEVESVFRTYGIGVCEGPISGFIRVWRNGILVYDVSDNQILSAAENSLFLETASFYTGEYDQDPSPDLEALLGIGTTPSHRGTAYVVFADEDLTDLRGAIPQYTFQVARGEGFYGVVQLSGDDIHNSRDNAECVAGVRLNASGAIEYTNPDGTWVNGNEPAGEWLQQGAGVFWARATENTGAIDAGTPDVWIHIGTSPGWKAVQTPAGTAAANITIEVATDAAGLNIVASGDYDLEAIHKNVPIAVSDLDLTSIDSVSELDDAIIVIKFSGTTGELKYVTDYDDWLSSNYTSVPDEWVIGWPVGGLSGDYQMGWIDQDPDGSAQVWIHVGSLMNVGDWHGIFSGDFELRFRRFYNTHGAGTYTNSLTFGIRETGETDPLITFTLDITLTLTA